MTLSFLRPAILVALALAGLAGCGGKADYEIAGTVSGQKYKGLVLTDTISGASITIDDVSTEQTRFAFPNTIEYGTEYNVVVAGTPPSTGQPPHQTCTVDQRTSADTAGRRAAIDIAVGCVINQFSISGKISLADGTTGSVHGLQLINGSNDSAPITVADPVLPATTVTTANYAYTAIPFGTTYGITVLKQPAGLTCQFKPTGGAIANTAAGTMGDADLVIDVICKKA